MNPDTNKFEPLDKMPKEEFLKKVFGDGAFEPDTTKMLLRPDGTEVPKHWSVFVIGTNYVINNYTFKCVYIGETSILFEPVKPMVIGAEVK